MSVFISVEGHLDGNMLSTATSEGQTMDRIAQNYARAGAERIGMLKTALDLAPTSTLSLDLDSERLSSWAQSDAKRFFDLVCVLLAMPLLVPVLLVIALAVRLTSLGPVLFLQERVGLHGRIFTILKFRTMVHVTDKAHHAVTTVGNQRFTSIGPFLRRWKLDELPQLLNVLAGHMSLVGSRPKMPEHVLYNLPCRPGITGAATNAFAREEAILNHVPKEHLDAYYHKVVLPAKRRLDVEYMTRATFRSDFKLLVNSVLRRWNTSAMESALDAAAYEAEYRALLTWDVTALALEPMAPRGEMPDRAEQVVAF
jgi:lipopolysaccharide/colanic/teichoic acid biosynthesis glycosyltransferase